MNDPLLNIESLTASMRACRVCESHLALGPRPVFVLNPSARILIIGQAPGSKVHASGIPWDDPSGERLRDWMGLSRDEFYDPGNVAILPMGLCYPGTGKSGDLPPRPECAPLWHPPALTALRNIRLTLLIGAYARERYLPDADSLTEACLLYTSDAADE